VVKKEHEYYEVRREARRIERALLTLILGAFASGFVLILVYSTWHKLDEVRQALKFLG
jgi:hypothetical protein